MYTAIVNSAHFKRDLRVVYLVKRVGGKAKTALLFSTDTSLEAMTLVTYDKARFQIEFLFREAKQFLGLNDCQTRKQQALHFPGNIWTRCQIPAVRKSAWIRCRNTCKKCKNAWK